MVADERARARGGSGGQGSILAKTWRLAPLALALAGLGATPAWAVGSPSLSAHTPTANQLNVGRSQALQLGFSANATLTDSSAGGNFFLRGSQTARYSGGSFGGNGSTQVSYTLGASPLNRYKAGETVSVSYVATGASRQFQFVAAATGGYANFADSGQTLGSGALSVALGDLDGDGDLDLVEGTRVWVNNGNGTFTDSSQSLGNSTYSVALGDVDGDGDLDIVVSAYTQADRVWLNDGSGHFTNSGQSLGSYQTRSVALGDVDGDGDLDLIEGNEGGDRVWLNDGGGTFTDSGQFLGNNHTRGVALGDVDGDGDLDLIDGNYGQPSRVWLNDGNGSFTDSGQTLGTYFTYSVALGDVDGDGDLDLIQGNISEPDRVWINNGNGSFTDSGQTLGNHRSYSVALGDVDGDGDLDIVEGNYRQPDRVWLNNGSGSFTDSGQTLGNHQTRSVALGDVDGDGDLDVIEGNSNQAARVWKNLPVPMAVAATTLSTPASHAVAAPASGNVAVVFPDTMVGGTYSSSSFKVVGAESGVHAGTLSASGGTLTFDPAANFKPGETVTVQLTSGLVSAGGYPLAAGKNFQFTVAATAGSGSFADSGQTLGSGTLSLALGDVDGDGDLDLVEGTRVWLNNGSGTFTGSGQTLGNYATYSVALGDVDGDGYLDIVEGNYGQPDRVWLNNGSGTFTDSGQTLGDHKTYSVALGDVDGDGDLDIVEGNYGQPDRVWLNNGSGTFADSGQALGNNQTSSLTLGDIDGDGDLDLIEGYFGSTLVWLNNGSGTFTDSGQTLGDHNTLGVALGDVDGDGDLDLIQGNYNLTLVWLNNGSGNFSNSGQSLGGYKTYGVALGDVDGDGDLDVVQGNNGQPDRVWLNNGSGSFTDSGQTLGAHLTTRVVLGDLDGDGSLDLVEGNYTQASRVWKNKPVPMAVASTTLASPASHAVAAAASGNVAVVFPDTMAGGTYAASSFKVVGAESGLHAGTFSAGGNTLTFDPTVNFKPGETVTVQLTTGLVSAGGHPLAAGKNFQFTVAATGGSGTFTDSGQTLGDHWTRSVVLGDLDNDGDLDLIEGNHYQPTRVWFNNGGGSFTDSGQTLGDHATFAVALGDLDNDGDLDLIMGNYMQPARVWLNNGSGTFTDSGQALGGYATTSVALGDVDGDGDLDLVEGNYLGPGRIWLNNGGGTFTDSGQTLGIGNGYTDSVALGDVDGDGDLDLVEGHYLRQPNKVWLNNGGGTFTDSGQALGNHDTVSVALGDVDGDGDLDIVEGNYRQPDRVWLNNGGGTFTASGQTLGNHKTRGIALGDIDGDGDLDLIEGNFRQADRVWLNNGSGIFTDSGQTLGNHGTYSVALGDVDGDGSLDLVEGNNGQVTRVWRNQPAIHNVPGGGGIAGPIVPAGGGSFYVQNTGQTLTIVENGQGGSTIIMASGSQANVNLPGGGTVGVQSQGGSRLAVGATQVNGHPTQVLTVAGGSATVTATQAGQAILSAGGITIVSGQSGSSSTASVDPQGGVNIQVASGDTMLVDSGATNTRIFLSEGGVIQVQPGGETIASGTGGATIAFSTVEMDGVPTPVPTVVSGEVTVSVPASCAPMLAVGGTPLSSSGGNTEAQAGEDNGFVTVTLTAGQSLVGTCPAGNRIAQAPASVYQGESAEFTPDGVLQKIRLGSLRRDQGWTGDPLSLTGFGGSVFKASVANISGTAKRLRQDLGTAFLAAINQGTGNAWAYQAQGQDAGTGVWTLQAQTPIGANGRLAVWPVGEVVVDQGADTLRTSGNGLIQVRTGNLLASFAPALVDPQGFAAEVAKGGAAQLVFQPDGTLHAVFGKLVYVLQPDWDVLPGTVQGFALDSQGRLTWTDAKGNSQVLDPAFASLGQLIAAFQAEAPSFAFQYAWRGQVGVVFMGVPMVLIPDNVLTLTPEAHKQDNWWEDGNKAYIRYSTYTYGGWSDFCQGFSVRLP